MVAVVGSLFVRRLSRATWACAMLVVFAGESAPAQAEVAELGGVDVYGTEAFDAAGVRAEFGKELDALREALDSGDVERSTAVEASIVSALHKRGDFALIDIGVITYAKQVRTQYVSIDVVESADRARRMPFNPAPQGKIADPDGLQQLWSDYLQVVRKFIGASKAQRCEVLHCIVPFNTDAELLPFLERINAKVRGNEQLLYDMAEKASSHGVRGNAIYLLAHSDDVDRLLPMLGRAIYDPSPYVRNNAMRVMAYIAEVYPERPYPIADLARAMEFPAATDRNKAGYVLSKLIASRHKQQIADLVLLSALRQLRLQQPINHDPAFDLLKGLSGKDFAERDYEAWERWVAQRSSTAKPSATSKSK